MPKILSESQIEHFRRDGCVFPIRVMPEAEALAIRSRLEDYEAKSGGPLAGDLRHKTHLLFPWLADLVRNARIVDAIEDLYGPNLLCWTTNFFIKEASNPAFVSWHQDSTYWGLSRPDVVTAWVALTPSNRSNGAMTFIPGTHLSDQLEHRDTFAKNNLLTRGQEVAVEVDESQAVTIELQPGEISLHHVRLVHGSPAIRRATGASALRSGISPPVSRKSRARTARPWCAASTRFITSLPSRGLLPTCSRTSSRCTGKLPSGTRKFSIAVRKSRATTIPSHSPAAPRSEQQAHRRRHRGGFVVLQRRGGSRARRGQCPFRHRCACTDPD